jgi:AcrR family transcriptional regulator
MIAESKSDFPTPAPAAPAKAVKPGARALAKQRTRERVLAAARRLFTELGYEGATIRQIAQAAGMSTGAVFASFADKDALFEEIILADDALRIDAMREAVRNAKTVDEAILGAFTVSYGFHLQHLPLLQARIGCSWTRSAETEFRMREARAPIFQLIEDALADGVRRGELKRGADLRLIAQMLQDLALSNYRFAIYDGWGGAELLKRMGDQVKLVLAGLRA